jgi:16S rRNA A1518/A1519 N6-dimethyltransferase RsmA/KsgA/DIM1 with predicted DNA glycosylase/AP lyase activity
MSRIQPDALQAYLSKPSHRPQQQQQQQGVAAQGGGVETMKSVIEVGVGLGQLVLRLLRRDVLLVCWWDARVVQQLASCDPAAVTSTETASMVLGLTAAFAVC